MHTIEDKLRASRLFTARQEARQWMDSKGIKPLDQGGSLWKRPRRQTYWPKRHDGNPF